MVTGPLLTLVIDNTGAVTGYGIVTQNIFRELNNR